MKTYVYPAVLYSGDDGFEYLSLPDLNLLTGGDTTEDTFVKGRQSLISYFELATRFDTEIPEPSSFDDIKKQYPNKNVVMLSEESYNNLMENAYIMGNKANYDWLMESKAQLERGKTSMQKWK